MWDLIVSVPDHCLSFYFGYIILSLKKPGVPGKPEKKDY